MTIQRSVPFAAAPWIKKSGFGIAGSNLETILNPAGIAGNDRDASVQIVINQEFPKKRGNFRPVNEIRGRTTSIASSRVMMDRAGCAHPFKLDRYWKDGMRSSPEIAGITMRASPASCFDLNHSDWSTSRQAQIQF